MIVKSITPLSDNELNKIREIFDTEENPEEALYNYFPYAFHHITDGTVYFGAHSYDYTYAIYPSKRSITQTE